MIVAGIVRTSDGGIAVEVSVSMMTNEPVDTVRDELVPISLDERLRVFEASLITWALTTCRGNKSSAARLLQVKRSTLGDRIRRCGLDLTTGDGRAEERR